MFIAYKLSLDYHADCLDFLDRRRGRQKLNKEAGTIEGWEVSYNLGYHRIRPFESFRRTRTSQVFSSLPSQLSCEQLSRSNRHILSRSKQCSSQSVASSCRLEPAQIRAIMANAECTAARRDSPR